MIIYFKKIIIRT